MSTPIKSFTLTELKIDEKKGTFEAIFIGDFNAVDHDGDSYDPGAIGNQAVKISQWNHGSWGKNAGSLPIGVGRIFEQMHGDVRKAHVQGEFDMDDPDAIKTYKKLIYFDSKGHTVEWSYALPETEWRVGERMGQQNVRIFTRIYVPEVSPVLLGAGVDTELLSIKGGNMSGTGKQVEGNPSKRLIDHIDEVAEGVEKLSARITDLHKERSEKGEVISKRSLFHMKGLKTALEELAVSIDTATGEESEEESNEEVTEDQSDLRTIHNSLEATNGSE